MAIARPALVRFVAACALAALVLPAAPASATDAQLALQLTERGIELQKAGQHARAVALFDAALAEYDHPKIRYFRAKSLRALARYDEAIAEFDRIKDEPQVAKYRDEVLVFLRDIAGERERQLLKEKLEAERLAREALERDRAALAEKAERAAVERLRASRSGLLPPLDRRAGDGSPTARIVPLVPAFAAPSGEYPGVVEAMRLRQDLEDYEAELSLAKVFTVTAVVGVSIGVGLGANPLSGGETGPGMRQTGLAVGVVGLMSGLVAAILWPDEPRDARPALQPMGAAPGVALR